MQGNLLQWPHLIGIALSFGAVIVIGIVCGRRNKSAESYFLAGRNMPGWVVGISLMAAASSMTFLAMPGFAYQENWRYLPTYAMYPIAGLVALFLFVPFFRRSNVSSAYEYLEWRFGLWARLYAAAGFLIFQFFKMGIVLYAVSLPVRTMTGFSIPSIILVFGIIIAFYTVIGGLEAVMWTDVLQGAALALGGLLCLPVIITKLPGGFAQILEVGYADSKLSLGSTAFSMNEKTIWVMALTGFFFYFQSMCTEQMTVQRYLAARTDRQARTSIIISAATTFPVWIYFTFLGTALYVFYKVLPSAETANLLPEQILPLFILTEIPAWIAGFILAGLFAAAMSTLDSSINASAATVTTDFYRRLIVRNQTEKHYLRVGRLLSFVFAAIMVVVAMIIHFSRTTTLADLQLTFIAILSGGLLGLFLLGFLTRRVDNIAAIVATACTVLGVSAWLVLDTGWGREHFPKAADLVPDQFWTNVVANIFLFTCGYIITVVLRRKSRKVLQNLTIWTD